MLKVVVDTNVFISGLLNPSSNCGKILQKLSENKFTLVLSAPILKEFMDVAKRPKFHKLITNETVAKTTEVLLSQALFVKPLKSIAVIQNDPDDNRFIEAAITAKADCIVSGDDHLLNLKNFRNISILSPNGFLDKLNKA